MAGRGSPYDGTDGRNLGYAVEKGWAALRFLYGRVGMTLARKAAVFTPSASVSITDQNLTDPEVPATMRYALWANGYAYGIYTFSTPLLEQWVTPTTAASDYEVLATITSGTLSSGTTGVWLALTSDRTWTVYKATAPSKVCIFRVDIRRIGTVTILDSATISITASPTV